MPCMIFGREPALVAGAVMALVNLAVLFGVDLTADQIAGINTALAAVLAVVVRRAVTPTGGDE